MKTFNYSPAPEDPGQNFLFNVASFLRDLEAYASTPRKFRMTKADVLTTAGAFDPEPGAPPGPVPKGLAQEKAKAVFESSFGHLSPELQREKADADAERTAADAECNAIDQEIAGAPEWVRPDGRAATLPDTEGPERDGEGGAAVPASSDQGPEAHRAENAGRAATAPSWGEKLFALLLLALILALSSYAWFNTANLSLDVTQSWSRGLLATVPIFFAPWFAKLILDLAAKQWPSARPALMCSLVVLGIAAFALFLFGFWQNVLTNDSLGSVFQRLSLPVSPIGIQIASQILYECCFGLLLVEKLLSIRRSWCRRNPWRKTLEEDKRQASARYNAADARYRQATSSLAALDSDGDTFADFVVRLVSLKWQRRRGEFANLEGLGTLLDRLAYPNGAQGGAHPDWLDFVKFLRGRQSDGRQAQVPFSPNKYQTKLNHQNP